MISSKISTHLGTTFTVTYVTLFLIHYFSPILALYEIKLLDGVNYCHLRAQLNERNNNYCLFLTYNISGIKL